MKKLFYFPALIAALILSIALSIAADVERQNAAQVTASAPAAVGAVPVYATVPSGGDDTALLQAIYNITPDGGVMTLRASPTTSKFTINGSLNFTSTKSVNYDWTGTVLSVAPSQSITMGFPLGYRGCSQSIKGGQIFGNVTLQEYGYTRFEPFNIRGTLTICASLASPYINISCRGGIGSTTGPAVVLDMRSPQAWCNNVCFRDMHVMGAPGQPVIRVLNKTATWNPGLWYFNNCMFEQNGGILFDVGKFACMFDVCYWEPGETWQPGTIDPSSAIVFRDCGGNLPPWLLTNPNPPFVREGLTWQ